MSIAISLSITAAFLILYSQSETTNQMLNAIDYMGKLIMAFGFTFAYIGSGLTDSKLYFPLLFLTVVILIGNLVVVQFETGRVIAFWASIICLAAVYVYDFTYYSNPKEKHVFYIPMFVESSILGCAYLLYYFQLPERLCRKARFVQLYLNGYIIFTLFLINFIYEASCILYYAIRLNSGTYDDYDDDWWRMDNLINR